ncbi:MAG: type II secretion system F family protein [Candidatus Aenigmatarchaeota archaeon]
MRIPLLPFKTEVALNYARKFFGVSKEMAKLFPSLSYELKQAKVDLNPREYIALAIFTAFFYFALMIFITIFLGIISNPLNPLAAFTPTYLVTMLSLDIGITFFVFYYVILYPKMLLIKKIRLLERDLLYALRHLLIQVRSGVTLFNAMVSVAAGDYGLVSEEFEEAVKEINAGVSEIEALENMSFRNPSLYFRRVIWQLVNGMRAGSDIATTLREIVNGLAIDQRIEIRRYGAQLNPMALMYLMTAVIIPTLGITFIIILSSFFGLSFLPLDIFLYLILGFLIIFQFMFIGLIKVRRPSLEV